MTGESDLAVCMDIHGENWQETFLQQIGQSETEAKEDEDDEETNDDDQPNLPGGTQSTRRCAAVSTVSRTRERSDGHWL